MESNEWRIFLLKDAVFIRFNYPFSAIILNITLFDLFCSVYNTLIYNLKSIHTMRKIIEDSHFPKNNFYKNIL